MRPLSTYAIVRCFFGDLHVVDVGFSHASAGDAHKLRLGTHLLDVGAAGVTHRGTQTAHQLVNDRGERPFVRNATFDAFRHQLLGTRRGVLEVTVEEPWDCDIAPSEPMPR